MPKITKTSAYFAHKALRTIMMKPLLVSYIILVDFVHMRFEWFLCYYVTTLSKY